MYLILSGNPHAGALFDDLLSSYNKLIRPVSQNSDVLKIRFKIRLSQLVDVVTVVFILKTLIS